MLANEVSQSVIYLSIYHREVRLNITEVLEALAVRCAGSTVLRPPCRNIAG